MERAEAAALVREEIARSELSTRVRQLQGRTIAGAVVGTVAPSVSIVSGEGFSVIRNGAGDYSITWATPFTTIPTVVPGMGSTAAVLMAKIHAGGPAGLLGVRLLIITPAGVATDGEVHFIARGRG